MALAISESFSSATVVCWKLNHIFPKCSNSLIMKAPVSSLKTSNLNTTAKEGAFLSNSAYTCSPNLMAEGTPYVFHIELSILSSCTLNLLPGPIFSNCIIKPYEYFPLMKYSFISPFCNCEIHGCNSQ